MRSRFLVAALLLVTGCFHAKADTVTIGDSSGGNSYPFSPGSYTGEYQQAYSAAAFSGPVTISALTFFPLTGLQNFSISGDYIVSLSTTTASLEGLSTSYAANLGSDDTVFASGVVSGVFTFTGTPFFYDPSRGNLLLDVQLLPSAPSLSILQAGCSPETTRVYNSGGMGAPTVGAPSNCGGGEQDGLRTQFTVSSSTVTPEPGSLWLLATGAVGVAGVVRRRRVM